MLACAMVAFGACSDSGTAPVEARTPTIAALTAGSDVAVIDGSTTPLTATLDNPASDELNVVIQGSLIQGAVRRSAGSMQVDCGGGAGVLPKGTCTVSLVVGASNDGAESGTLVAGTATVELQLTRNGTVLDTKTIPLNLVERPTIDAATLQLDTAAIDGSPVPLAVTIKNAGPAVSGVVLHGYVTQGATRRADDSVQVDCGSGAGVLPTGTCTVSFMLDASNSGAGTGTLVRGEANFEVQLTQNGTALHTQTGAMTLVDNLTISALSLNSDTAVIDGPQVPYMVTVANPGESYSDVTIRGYLTQGALRVSAGATVVFCIPGTPGVLPSGDCTSAYAFGAQNSDGAAGLLVQGAATLELVLTLNGTALDTKSFAVTLISNSPPKISALALSADTVTVGGTAVPFTATIENTGPSLAAVAVQGFVTQALSGATRVPAGGVGVTCGGGSGVLPTGVCQTPSSIGIFNDAGGAWTFQPGPATFELELYVYNYGVKTVIGTKTVVITLK
jgi:hypothetical protein